MGTVLDYVGWRGDLTFEQVPPNEVDNLIFSLLSYIEFKELVPSGHSDAPVSLQAVANAYFARYPNLRKANIGLIIPKEIVKLFKAVKETRRFRNVGMRAYVNEIDVEREMQFSAITFLLGKAGNVVAYRGTDDTLVGWKENFNMSFLPEVPSQVRAAQYLNEVAAQSKGRLYVTGHSKGGNLAVFAGVRCDQTVKERVVGIWNNDGPGFGSGMLTSADYLDMKPRIHTFLPKSSLVGILLEHDEDYTVVSSKQVGLWQHDGMSWNVMGGKFVYLRSIGEDSKHSDRTLNAWIREMTPEQREQFSEALYKILSSDHATTLTELASPKNRWLIRGMQLDPWVGKVMSKTLTALINENAKDFLHEMFGKSK